MTFSIAARDADAWGVAVASKFLAVGSVVPRVVLGHGAIATQAMARVAYLDELEAALRAGTPTGEALATALAGDDGGEHRQVGVVGPDGPASHTGSECLHWAGGRTGADGDTAYAIQGNILVGPEVVEAMEAAWHAHAGASLDHRLMAVLLAGDAAGGDARGRQSAALLVRRPGAGYDGSGVLADLRVDDHPEAPRELARLHELSSLYFGTAEDVRPLEGPLRAEVAALLTGVGHAPVSDDVEAALEAWMGEVNLENRHHPGGIDTRVLGVLRDGLPAGP
ncbi:DUF1028 domain-containing protein [Nostocoides sp. Soil756]|uniref:DUF1028 domain-containing protein n=1 Tax=Nostocoides sp. Soil756 TaxID=1736399 RepID=UPI0006F55B90|nr:DUF1028 domain-containing protein [Tetrasphaera sp. Soil756]KRE62850.1 fimbrial assembly protein FimA [Tetrasphaera sp. Soil756]